MTQTVHTASTTTTLSSSLNPSAFGSWVTFTASVAGATGSGTPTGAVTFYNGSTVLGSSSLSSGTATFSTSTLAVGSYAIEAVYGGDNTHAGSSSISLTETVGQATPSVTLYTTYITVPFGQSQTFEVYVNPPSWSVAGPTGTVILQDGTTQIGSTTLASGSTEVSFTTATLPVGTDTLTATYEGDGNYTSATSAPFTQTITQDTTSTSLSSSSNPASWGTPITLTATVSSYGASTTATGTLTFTDAAGTLGTASLNGNATSDQATLVVSNFAVGSYPVTATYSGNTDFSGSSSFAFTQMVNPASTNVSIASSSNPSVAGQSVTFTITVASSNGVGTPTGTVTLTNGYYTQFGQATLSNGQATFQVSTLSVGTNTIEASYGGSSTFYSSTSSFQQTVNKATPSVALSTSASSATFGQSVTFTATITPNSPEPTGYVYFMDGSTELGVVYLSGSNQVTFTTSTLPPGSQAITAQYQGDSNYNAANSAPLTETISAGNTTTVLTSSANPANVNSWVTLTATVTQAAGSTLPTGTVTFYNGSSVIGTATLDSYATDQASLSVSNLPAGVSSLTAQYGGSTDYNGSTSAVLTQTVNKLASAASLSVSANPATAGESVTLTASVTPASGFGTAPTGTVTFLNNGVSIGTGALNMYEEASLTVTAGFTPGTYSLTLQYGGDGTYSGASSATLTETVTRQPPASA